MAEVWQVWSRYGFQNCQPVQCRNRRRFQLWGKKLHADTSWASQNFFGFEFGFERFTERQSMQSSLLEMRSQNSQVEPEHLLAGLLLIQLQQVLIYFEQMVWRWTSKPMSILLNPVKIQSLVHRVSVLELALQTDFRVRSLWDWTSVVGFVQLKQTRPLWVTYFNVYEIDLRAPNNQLAETV